MTVIIAAAIVIAVIGLIVMMKNKNTRATAPENTPAPAASPEKEYRAIVDSLLKLNILLRKDRDLPGDMTRKIEAIIDDLMAITPAMMERYPGETLTYEIKKIGREHLFKTVKEYLDLSVDSRQNQFAIFKKTIESLHEVSHRSRDIVEKNETAEFKTMANFLAGKF